MSLLYLIVEAKIDIFLKTCNFLSAFFLNRPILWMNFILFLKIM